MAGIEFHSQAGQDLFVFSMFAGRPGYFVDVGAFDGVHISNTLVLETLGWDGVCIGSRLLDEFVLQRQVYQQVCGVRSLLIVR